MKSNCGKAFTVYKSNKIILNELENLRSSLSIKNKRVIFQEGAKKNKKKEVKQKKVKPILLTPKTKKSITSRVRTLTSAYPKEEKLSFYFHHHSRSEKNYKNQIAMSSIKKFSAFCTSNKKSVKTSLRENMITQKNKEDANFEKEIGKESCPKEVDDDSSKRMKFDLESSNFEISEIADEHLSSLPPPIFSTHSHKKREEILRTVSDLSLQFLPSIHFETLPSDEEINKMREEKKKSKIFLKTTQLEGIIHKTCSSQNSFLSPYKKTPL